MSNTTRRQRLAVLTFAVTAITACGGGGGGDTAAPPPPNVLSPSTVSGIVLLPVAAPGAPAPAPATVCYDSNRNGNCDSGEPTTMTDGGGAYTLTGLPTQQPADSALLAQIPTGSIAGYTLQAPASKPEVISSFTTLLQRGVGQGMGLPAAEIAVSRQVQASVQTLYSNYRTLPTGTDRIWLTTFASFIVQNLQTGTPLRVGPPTSPAAGYDVTSFIYTDALNHRVFYNYSAQVGDAATGLVPYHPLVFGMTNGQPSSIQALTLAFWTLTPQGWSLYYAQGAVQQQTAGNPYASLAASGTRSIISAQEVDVSGLTVGEVVTRARAVSASTNTFSTVVLPSTIDVATLTATMPANAKLKVVRSATMDTPASYRDSDRLDVPQASIAALIAAYPLLPAAASATESNSALLYRGATQFSSGGGTTRSCPTGSLTIDSASNQVCADSDLRASFDAGSTIARFYRCDAIFLSSITSVNCRDIGTSAVTLGTMSDQVTQTMAFTTLPVATASAAFQGRIVVQRPGGLYRASPASRAVSSYTIQTATRLNRVAFSSLSASLGLSAPNPSFSTPSPYIGRWHATMSFGNQPITDCETVVIDAAGLFTGTCLLSNGSSPTLYGTVTASGTTSFVVESANVAFTGQFTPTTASGTWHDVGNGDTGTWTATKY